MENFQKRLSPRIDLNPIAWSPGQQPFPTSHPSTVPSQATVWGGVPSPSPPEGALPLQVDTRSADDHTWEEAGPVAAADLENSHASSRKAEQFLLFIVRMS